MNVERRWLVFRVCNSHQAPETWNLYLNQYLRLASSEVKPEYAELSCLLVKIRVDLLLLGEK